MSIRKRVLLVEYYKTLWLTSNPTASEVVLFMTCVIGIFKLTDIYHKTPIQKQYLIVFMQHTYIGTTNSIVLT